MAIITTNPNDIPGQVILLGRITGLSMTATSVTNWYNNGQNTVLLTSWILRNFSAFPDGTAPPATWALSYGTNSAVTPNNMRAAGAISSAPSMPIVQQQAFSTSGLTPYIAPRTTLYFAVTTTTNGLGTFDAECYGIILAR